MTQADQERWGILHAGAGDQEKPSAFLQLVFDQFGSSLLPGRALDIACGRGRNSLFLAERGFDVVAMDISPVALAEGRKQAGEKSLSISWQQADLEEIELSAATYDLIVNFNYLQRSLVPRIKTSLKPGAHFIFETYLIDQQAIGHPKNPAYLLGHNELLELFSGVRMLYYREGKFTEGDQEAYRAGLFGQKVS
jgi:tellurite methyltransferase